MVGVGGGTGLLGLANLIPDTYPIIKTIVIYASPGAGVVLTFLWAYLSRQFERHLRRRQMEKALVDARKLRDLVLSDGHSSAEHRAMIQQNVEALERLMAELIGNTASNVRATFVE